MNPFISTRHLTDRKEDHLTEFFAAALEIDQTFRKSYAALLLGTYADRNGWQPPSIDKISTQAAYQELSSRPDLLLTLRDGHVIAVEHKLEAEETSVQLVSAEDPVRQLTRYLSLPIDGLAYVRSTLKPPSPEVLNHPKYIRPADKQHFLWRDFFPLFAEARTNQFVHWVEEGFEALGFTPPHPRIGDLDEPANRLNFAKLWATTRARASDKGWKVSSGNVTELYFSCTNARLAHQVWASPSSQRLLVRLTPARPELTATVLETITGIAAALPGRTVVESGTARRVAGVVDMVQVSAPLHSLAPEEASPDQIEHQLNRFVEPILAAAM